MINRVLIRIKTVQLLYSYLLVQNPFSLESQPTPLTKEKRFAYTLYLDTLFLLYKIAEKVKDANHVKPLLQSRFITKLELTERFRSLEAKYKTEQFPFNDIEQSLADEIKDSLLFKEYKQNLKEGMPTDHFWENVFKAIIKPNTAYNEIAKGMSFYSLSGFERMSVLMDDTFKKFYSTRDNIDDALATLSKSLGEARELYVRLLALPVELTALRRDQLALNRRKLLATTEDLHPNMRFVENVLPGMIESNKTFVDYIEKNKISWIAEDRELLEHLLNDILTSSIYEDYMSGSTQDRKSDIEFWKKIYRDVILANPDFLTYMEDKSVFWNDDLDIVSTFIIKSLKKFEEGDNEKAILPMYKDEEDSRFGSELFKFVISNKDLYQGYINKILLKDKWEADRLAFMDVVVVMTALAEILNFPKIPLVASINEYIEIAKSYSTGKSGSFVNGILASAITMLKEEGLLNK